MTQLEESLSSLFVPKEILDHFEVKSLTEKDGVLIIDLDEKSDGKHIPKAIVRVGKAVLSGYCNTIELQTFPAQGKEVFLRLRRRRWKRKGTTKAYSNSYEFHETGMKCTKIFGAFLKEIDR